MIKKSISSDSAARSRRESSEYTAPVGLLGVQMITALVLSVTDWRMAVTSRLQSERRGTNTGTPPAMRTISG